MPNRFSCNRIQGELESVPYDYKFYMFGGTIAGVLIVKHRGLHNECQMWVDEQFHRLDTRGCTFRDEEDIGEYAWSHKKEVRTECLRDNSTLDSHDIERSESQNGVGKDVKVFSGDVTNESVAMFISVRISHFI